MRIEESICPLLTVAGAEIAEGEEANSFKTVTCQPLQCMMSVKTPEGYYCGLALGQYASNRVEVPNVVQ